MMLNEKGKSASPSEWLPGRAVLSSPHVLTHPHMAPTSLSCALLCTPGTATAGGRGAQ